MSTTRVGIIAAACTGHLEVAVLHALDVETNRRHRRDLLAQFELVERSRLSGGIEAEPNRQIAVKSNRFVDDF